MPKPKRKPSPVPRKTLTQLHAKRDAIIRSPLSTAEKLKRLRAITQDSP